MMKQVNFILNLPKVKFVCKLLVNKMIILNKVFLLFYFKRLKNIKFKNLKQKITVTSKNMFLPRSKNLLHLLLKILFMIFKLLVQEDNWHPI